MKGRASSQAYAVGDPEGVRSPRILIVARAAQRLSAELPARLGDSLDCRIAAATAVSSGREQLLELVPHAVVVDLGLGKKEVLDWVRQVRADPLRSELPVIAIGTSSSAAARRHALEAGCDHYIAPPVDVEALASLLTRAMSVADRPPPDTAVRRIGSPRAPSPELGPSPRTAPSSTRRQHKPSSRFQHAKAQAEEVAVVVWFSEEEFRTVAELASTHGRDPADWVRLRARSQEDELLPRPPWPPRKQPKAAARSRPARPGEAAPATMPLGRVRDDTRRRLLGLLVRDGRLFPRFIAERLGISRARAWNALQMLEEEGCVRRCEGPDAMFEATGKPLKTTS